MWIIIVLVNTTQVKKNNTKNYFICSHEEEKGAETEADKGQDMSLTDQWHLS